MTERLLKEMGEIQIDLRAQEVYETYHHFAHLATTGRDQRTVQIGDSADTPSDQVAAFVESLKGKVKLDEVYLSGHSFGGGTMVRCYPVSIVHQDHAHCLATYFTNSTAR